MIDDRFDDIRPYYEEEIPAAMQRIAASDAFPLISSFVFPSIPTEEARKMVASIQSIEEFQSKVMSVFNDQVVERSITKFSFGGLDLIEKGKPYLFVSNHRDIVLDSSLLQNMLYKNGFETTEITFGANLMCSPLIIDIGKSNKMFRVERGATPKEFYRHSLHLSEYIHHVIEDKQKSVWIAQRNGRTKDGNDHTDQGIIRMFEMGGNGDKVKSLNSLNIVPVCVSYEWESCDILKSIELYIRRTQKYIKRPGEDVNSILTGITDPKGRVHFEICEPIHIEELELLSDCTQNEFNNRVARLMDKRINSKFHLWPNNYIAHDILFGEKRYQDQYTDAEYQSFMDRIKCLHEMGSMEQYEVSDLDVLTDIFLKIYATPVDNKVID